MADVVLINPVAGGGRSVELWQAVSAEVGVGTSFEVEMTTSAADASRRAERAAAAGARVIAVGGDGLVRDVAAGVVAGDGVMAVVPAGRGNDFARRLGIPEQPAELAEMLRADVVRRVDVLDVNGHMVPGNVYVGIDSVAARIINRHRRLPAAVIYRLAGVLAVARWRPTRFTITYLDARDVEVTRVVRAHDMVLANTGRYGHGLNIVPSAEPDDGLIDVLIVAHGPRRRIFTFLLAAQRGAHVNRADVEVLRTSQLTLSADRPVPFGADGDEVTELPARVVVRRAALGVVVPAG